MKIIIVGIGKLGEYLTRNLVKENNEITVIDNDYTTGKDLINNVDVNYVDGSGLDPNVLIEADVKNADLVISVMDKDESNIMCSLLSKKLGAKNTIARIRGLEYSNMISTLKEELGLSMTINPELLTANNVASALSIPSVLESTSFFKGKIHMVSLKVREKGKLQGLTLTNLLKKCNTKIIICLIERNGKRIIPKGSTKLQVNDKIHIVGTIKEIKDFLEYAGLIEEKTKKVMICGGSTTAVYLARNLLDLKMQVKIIEIDSERCKVLSETLPKALIINGDVSDQNILYEEGIDNCDAFIPLTSIDEENIVYSMFASMRGVPRIITKINHIDLDGIVEKANVDTVITPHRIAANQIIKYVRAMQNKKISSCEAVYKFDDDKFEMIEFNVKDDFKAKNIKIKDMKLKENILIVSILRGRNIITPNGGEVIKKNDTVVIIDSTDSVNNINDILE